MKAADVAVVNRYNAFFNTMNECLVKRDGIVEQLRFAVACGEHLLMEGKPGVAKSYFAHLFLGNVEGAKTFSVACTKKMSEDYLVGPLDMRLFREKGIMVHRTENTIVDCDFAFVDEIFDLSSGASRGLLEILNERTFTRGIQAVDCYLSTCIAATNFNKESEEEMEAVLDRFMFRANVGGLTNDKDKLKMLMLKADMRKISLKDILRVQDLVSRVDVPTDVLKNYVDIIGKLPKVTDRSLRKGIKVLQTAAVLEGRTRAITSDITKCEYAFSVIGDAASGTEFSSAMSRYAQISQSIQEELKANVLFNRMSKLSAEMTAKLEDSSTTFDEVVDQAREIVTIKHIAQTKITAQTSLRGRILSYCDKILMQVDLIRDRDNDNA